MIWTRFLGFPFFVFGGAVAFLCLSLFPNPSRLLLVLAHAYTLVQRRVDHRGRLLRYRLVYSLVVGERDCQTCLRNRTAGAILVESLSQTSSSSMVCIYKHRMLAVRLGQEHGIRCSKRRIACVSALKIRRLASYSSSVTCSHASSTPQLPDQATPALAPTRHVLYFGGESLHTHRYIVYLCHQQLCLSSICVTWHVWQ